VNLLTDAHFWVGVALVIFSGILVLVGVPKLALGALDARAGKIQAQLDEANTLREEAQALLAQIKIQREQTDRLAQEVLADAREEARRLQIEAQARLAEQIERRGKLAKRRIATAEAQAAADVKAAAGEFAASIAEQVLAQRLAAAKKDPLIDEAIGQLAERLQ
jgi:F-type H+-transporting ATPase subunit b